MADISSDEARVRDQIRRERRKVFISFSRDLAGEAETLAGHIERLKTGPTDRLKFTDFDVIYYRTLDPADLNAVQGWQDSIGATGDGLVDLVIVLFGERIGVPTPDDFRFRDAIRAKLNAAGIDWIKVNGVDASFSATQTKAGPVPLTGTLFELFDAMLSPRHSDGVLRPVVIPVFVGERTGKPVNWGGRRWLDSINKRFEGDDELLQEAQGEYWIQVAKLRQVWQYLVAVSRRGQAAPGGLFACQPPTGEAARTG